MMAAAEASMKCTRKVGASKTLVDLVGAMKKKDSDAFEILLNPGEGLYVPAGFIIYETSDTENVSCRLTGLCPFAEIIGGAEPEGDHHETARVSARANFGAIDPSEKAVAKDAMYIYASGIFSKEK